MSRKAIGFGRREEKISEEFDKYSGRWLTVTIREGNNSIAGFVKRVEKEIVILSPYSDTRIINGKAVDLLINGELPIFCYDLVGPKIVTKKEIRRYLKYSNCQRQKDLEEESIDNQS